MSLKKVRDLWWRFSYVKIKGKHWKKYITSKHEKIGKTGFTVVHQQ